MENLSERNQNLASNLSFSILRTCLEAAPRRQPTQRAKMQDKWMPGTDEEAEEQAPENTYDNPDDEEDEADTPSEWLMQFTEQEREVATMGKGKDTEERFATCAYTLGFQRGPGRGLLTHTGSAAHTLTSLTH